MISLGVAAYLAVAAWQSTILVRDDVDDPCPFAIKVVAAVMTSLLWPWWAVRSFL